MRLGSSSACAALFLLGSISVAQPGATNAPAAAAPVPYSSVSELNLLLSQVEQNSQDTQADLSKLRIEKWKTDANTKRLSEADVASVQRNLQSALPEMVTQLRNSPENMEASFKLYRNLDALYDVFGSIVESAGAFGSRDEFQSLQNDLSGLERARRSLADRIDTLASNKEGELTRLRTQVQTLQAAAAQQQAAPPKKVVVDDTEAPKKSVAKKKPAAKKPSTQSQTQPAQNPPPQPPQTQPQ